MTVSTTRQSQATTTSSEASGPASSSTAGAAVQRKSSLRGLDYATQLKALSPSVQREGDGSGAADVHAAAARGTAGSGASLPHLDTIQQAFGSHDVSDVQAHVGGAAKDASASMGAEAYASGNDVAFAETPSLHTAAHEAAHVVQQSAGVSLSEGVGQSGDSYEQHADHVADAVVAGKSAEPILTAMAGGAGGEVQANSVQHKGVQRLDTPPTTTPEATPPAADASAEHTNEPIVSPNNLPAKMGELKVGEAPVLQVYGYGGVRNVFGKKVSEMEAELAALEEKEEAGAPDAPAAPESAAGDGPPAPAAPMPALNLEEQEKMRHYRAQIDDINRTKAEDYLIFAGHIGVSLDGGATIYGFTPEAPEGMPAATIIKHLHEHTMTFPGVCKDDKPHFDLATECATSRGWDTEVAHVNRKVDTKTAASMLFQLQQFAGMQAGAHGVYYSFPLKSEENGEWFKDTPGPDGKMVKAEKQANCATFPGQLGIELPERSGNLRYYMPALRNEAAAEA